MGDFFKWGLVALAVFLLYRWMQNGIGLNASLGPNYGYGGGIPTQPPHAGFSFMGPGLTLGFNPDTFGF